MFQIEIDEQDGLIDLVALMARQAGAEFRARTVIETSSTRLAYAVGALLNRVVECDRPQIGLSEIRTVEGVTEEGVDLDEMRVTLGLTEEAETGDPGLPSPNAGGLKSGAKGKFYGKCEFCDRPRLPRSKTCGGEECGELLNQKHQLAYQARKEAKAAQADQAALASAEVAASKPPFAKKSTEPVYLGAGLPGEFLTFEQLMKGNQSGEIPDGTRIQAQPSGRWYVLRAGRLTPDGAAGQ